MTVQSSMPYQHRRHSLVLTTSVITCSRQSIQQATATSTSPPPYCSERRRNEAKR